jgi:type I restriction enzyme M protein
LRLPAGSFYANDVKANVLFFETKPVSKEAMTKEIWIYDYRTNVHHTLKKNPMKYSDLEDFIRCYNPENRFLCKETWSEETLEGRFRKFSYEEILARDKTNLDIFWLKAKSLADLDNLPGPDILANEIVENMEVSLASFKEIMLTINGDPEK